ncbi:hypothetical protein HC931_07220 [Candidatus Gracilibacteria bacterium]|nr:hypothetical protein [Candidatus Gracilibacteria bacterium]
MYKFYCLAIAAFFLALPIPNLASNLVEPSTSRGQAHFNSGFSSRRSHTAPGLRSPLIVSISYSQQLPGLALYSL